MMEPDQLPCVVCYVSTSMLTYVRGVLAHACISDLIREGICPVTRPHFPNVVGLWGTLPTKIYTQSSQRYKQHHTQLYYIYSSKYGRWMGTHKRILYMHTDLD